MDASRVTTQIAVGECPKGEADVAQLKQRFGISAVLNLQTDADLALYGIDWEKMAATYRRWAVAVTRAPVIDFNPADLRRKLPGCVAALGGLLAAGHMVYVHCNVGINRSPTVVIAHLHWAEGRPLDEAAAQVFAFRRCDPSLTAIQLATADWQAGRTAPPTGD